VLESMYGYHQQLHTGAGNGNRHATIKLGGMSTEQLFDFMVEQRLLRLAVIIAGQGPKGFGMPEMFTPMQHLNANRLLRKLSVLLSDGRYSGVTYGAAVGHITPEALYNGAIVAICDGDLLQISLRDRRIDWLRLEQFVDGKIEPHDVDSLREVLRERTALIDERLNRLKQRASAIVPTNRLLNVTDASLGVVPLELLELEGDLN